NPSMKLDRRYHCFACQADGDVINLVAAIFGIGNKEAAEKIAADFGISYETRKRAAHRSGREGKKRQPDQARQVERQRRYRFEETQKRFYLILTDYYHLLREWKEKHAPASPEDEPDEYFCEALRNIDLVEHVLDCYLQGTLEERIDIINGYGEKVKEYERRIEQYRSGEAGSPG
ncbi:MAG: CHC2 zinc finger domain-containing protein, partial [Eubacterium sp.]|nr:CHC2 zinc finger domain-containing protein [Eubacterium sp.]